MYIVNSLLNVPLRFFLFVHETPITVDTVNVRHLTSFE